MNEYRFASDVGHLSVIYQNLSASEKKSVLLVPDPESQFIVEVDASDANVGAVLPQSSPCDVKVHSCA